MRSNCLLATAKLVKFGEMTKCMGLKNLACQGILANFAARNEQEIRCYHRFFRWGAQGAPVSHRAVAQAGGQAGDGLDACHL